MVSLVSRSYACLVVLLTYIRSLFLSLLLVYITWFENFSEGFILIE